MAVRPVLSRSIWVPAIATLWLVPMFCSTAEASQGDRKLSSIGPAARRSHRPVHPSITTAKAAPTPIASFAHLRPPRRAPHAATKRA